MTIGAAFGSGLDSTGAGAGVSVATNSDGADVVAAAVVFVVLGVVGGESGVGAFVGKFQQSTSKMLKWLAAKVPIVGGEFSTQL